MVGIDSDDPNYQRGFVIVLSNGAGTISVWAEVNSADEFSLHSAAASSLAELRKRADHVFSPIYVTQQIGGRRAEGVSVKFVCKGSEVQYGFQSVGTVDRSGRFVYSLIWEGPQSGVLVAKRTMGALERSWRFIPAQ